MRRLIALLAVSAIALGNGQGRAAGPDPIEGTWSFAGGAVTVIATGPGHFSGTITKPTKFDVCVHPAGQVVWDITAAGGHYTGTHVGFHNDTCQPYPGFQSTWEVKEAGGGKLELTFCSTAPDSGNYGCTTLERLKPPGGPITGYWNFSGGIVNVTGSAPSFTGTVVKETKFGTCPHSVGEVMWRITQNADGTYRGTHLGFASSTDCSKRETHIAVFTVSGDTLFARIGRAVGQEPTDCTIADCFTLSRAQPPAPETKLADTRAYRTFYGLDDPAEPNLSAWRRTLSQRAQLLAARAARFPGVTSKAEIPGESFTSLIHSPFILHPGNDLRVLLQDPVPPSTQFADGNVYARVTPVLEQRLRAKILTSRGGLVPADVMQYALEVTGGSYPLAVLVAHNLLKNVAYIGRNTADEALKAEQQRPALKSQAAIDKYEGDQKERLAKLERQAAVVGKLLSLRKTPKRTGDKIGPWYHAFAVLTAGALVTPAASHGVVMAEHGFKLAQLFKNEGGFDIEKFIIDREFAFVATSKQLRALSR